MSYSAPLGFQEVLRASDWSELLQAMKTADWKVNPDRKKRSAREMELWVLKHALLAANAKAVFPMLCDGAVLYHSDKPDFWISANGLVLGIEISEITSELAARAATDASELTQDVHFIPKPSDFQTRPSKADLAAVMTGERQTGPWLGAAPEMEFSELVVDLIQKKVRKARGYARATSNLLLLYDNASLPQDAHLFEKSGARARISDAAKAARETFDQVLILSGSGQTLSRY